MGKFEDQLKDLDIAEETTQAVDEIQDLKKKKSKKDDKNTIYTSFIETDNYILEQIVIATPATHATSPAESRYLKFDKNLGTIEKIDKFENNKLTYKPIVGDILNKGVVLLPTDAIDYENTDKLVKQLRDFFNKYFEAPNFSQNLFPYLTLFYWVYDRFPFIPYVHFMGRTGTGKTTAMEVLGSVCYKPIDASGAITLASIFRVVSEWKGTLLIDEFAPGGDGYREMLALLKSGVSDRSVLRVEGEKKKEVCAYIVKSPKMFTSEKPIHDVGLRSRVIEVKMEKNTRKIPLYRQNDFLEEAQELRNKLLFWRLKKLSEIDLTKIKFGFKSLSSFDGRTQQVITPIYYMANKEAKKDIVKFAKEQEEETLRERRESIDGQIFQFIVDNFDPEGTEEITLPQLFEDISQTANNKYMTSRKIANITRKILGIEIERQGHENTRTLILRGREEKLKELCQYYGISVPSAWVARVAGVADVPDEVKKIFDT